MIGDDDPYAGVDLRPDCERTANKWTQILRDMTASAPMSHWASEVTTVRISSYDQIRPFVTRGAMLAAIFVLLRLAPETSCLTWILLTPAVFQVVFEIVLDFQLDAVESARTPVLRSLAAVAEAAHTRTLLNVTGVMGFVAVPCNIVAAAYFTGPGDPSWAKVLALGAASAYGVSGIMSFLTDATHYSANQSPLRPYRVFRAVRPHVWFIIMVLMTAIVAGSIFGGRWAGEMEPLAWALCVFPIVIGMKQRDYERFIRASSERLTNVQDGAKKALTKDYHNANTDIRTFNRDLANDKSLPPAIRVQAAALAPLISLMGEAIDHDKWASQQKRPSLAGIVDKYRSDASLDIAIDIRLDDLKPHNYDLARGLLAALLVNVGQAMANTRTELPDKLVTVTAEVRGDQIHVAVRDPLPMISEWRRAGSTTLWLHNDLIAHGSREGLTQHPVDPLRPSAGKEIRASWPVKKPPLKLREIRR